MRRCSTCLYWRDSALGLVASLAGGFHFGRIVMSDDPVRDFEESYRVLQKADGQLRRIMIAVKERRQSIREVERPVDDAQHQRLRVGTGIRAESEAGCIITETWPSGQTLREALTEWQVALNEADSAWRKLPSDRQADHPLPSSTY